MWRLAVILCVSQLTSLTLSIPTPDDPLKHLVATDDGHKDPHQNSEKDGFTNPLHSLFGSLGGYKPEETKPEDKPKPSSSPFSHIFGNPQIPSGYPPNSIPSGYPTNPPFYSPQFEKPVPLHPTHPTHPTTPPVASGTPSLGFNEIAQIKGNILNYFIIRSI